MLKAEKQAIICTLYTQHTPFNPSLPPTPTHVSASYQNVKAPTPPPEKRKQKKKQYLLCFKRQFRPDGGTKP